MSANIKALTNIDYLRCSNPECHDHSLFSAFIGDNKLYIACDRCGRTYTIVYTVVIEPIMFQETELDFDGTYRVLNQWKIIE